MQFQRRHFAALAGAAVLTPWSLAQAQTPAALEALHAAAKTEGEVSWYVAFLSSEDAEITSRAFTARYPGVKVNVVRTTAQVAYQRLNQDLQAKSAHCDVFSSTDVGHYIDLKQRKLLTKYTPAASAQMDKRLQNIDADLKSTAGDLKREIVEQSTSVIRVPLDQIDVNPKQPRHDFDETSLSELAASIKITV